MNYKQLLKLKKDIDLLIQGIDPQSQIYVGDDSILSSNYNQEVLKKASYIVNKIIKYGINLGKTDSRCKYNFYLEENEISNIKISDTPISISKFTYQINENVDIDTMKKLKATTITTWLLKNNYLEERKYDDGKTQRIPTSKGTELGIISSQKTSQYGRIYDVNVYSAKAQRFILDNLSIIIEDDNKNITI